MNFGMGSFFSKIGSDPYYAGYERSFETIKANIERLQDKLASRRKQVAVVDSTIFFYGAAGFAIALGLAAWALRQPAGKLNQKQHLLGVLPMFVEPVGAYLLYAVWNAIQSWLEQRDKSRLAGYESKLRKMVAELKDSTRYQKTQALLSKYDPDYSPPSPFVPAMRGFDTALPGTPLQSLYSAGAGSPRGTPQRRNTMGMSSLQRVTGAGARILPALDSLASSLIGDNPALMQMLREARAEAEALKERLANVEGRTAKLVAQNKRLRDRLGEDAGMEDEVPLDGVDDRPSQQLPFSRNSMPEAGNAAGDLSCSTHRAQSMSAPVSPLSRIHHTEFTQPIPEGQPDSADDDFTFLPIEAPAEIDESTNKQTQG